MTDYGLEHLPDRDPTAPGPAMPPSPCRVCKKMVDDPEAEDQSIFDAMDFEIDQPLCFSCAEVALMERRIDQAHDGPPQDEGDDGRRQW